MPTFTHTDEEDSKITISFRYIDEYHNEFESTSRVEVFYSLGDTALSEIGRQLNIFLAQVGFSRHGDNIYMESLTDDEYDAVDSFLAGYRADKEGGEENED